VSRQADLPEDLKEDLDVAIYESALVREALVWHKPSKTLLVSDSAFLVRVDISRAIALTTLQRVHVVTDMDSSSRFGRLVMFLRRSTRTTQTR
jgi:hypothetical protein